MQPMQGFQQHPVMIQAPVSHVRVSGMDQALGVKTTKCLGIMLMVTGLLMSGLQILCTVIVEEGEVRWTAHAAGTGVWCGIIIFISGVIGLQTALKKTNALAIAFLIFNILCAFIFAPIVIGTTGGDIGNKGSFCRYIWDHERRDCSNYAALLALTVLMLIDAVVVFILSVWGIVTNSTAIEKAKACACCCQCCQETASQTQTPIVIYMPANQMPLGSVGQPSQLYAFPNPGAYPIPNQAPENVAVAAGAPASAYPGIATATVCPGNEAVPPPYNYKA